MFCKYCGKETENEVCDECKNKENNETMKQINRENLKDYEYSLEEVSTNNIEIKEEKNPDIRYYACVVDKNRAGAKPKLLFKINLAYNSWEELGYLKLKQK